MVPRTPAWLYHDGAGTAHKLNIHECWAGTLRVVPHPHIEQIVKIMNSVATSPVPECCINLANSFHNLGGFDVRGLNNTLTSKFEFPAKLNKCDWAYVFH